MTFFPFLCFQNGSNCWETYEKVLKKMHTSDAVPHENNVLTTSHLKKCKIFLQGKKNQKFKDCSICLYCVPKPPRKRKYTDKSGAVSDWEHLEKEMEEGSTYCD